MKNLQQQAFPATMTDYDGEGGYETLVHDGLTKLEHACIQLRIPKTGDAELDAIIREAQLVELSKVAMQGLLANTEIMASTYRMAFKGEVDCPAHTAGMAVEYAKALLAELEKETVNQSNPQQ